MRTLPPITADPDTEFASWYLQSAKIMGAISSSATGWRVIGSGAFGKVYFNPAYPKWVIKAYTPYSGSRTAPGYADWLTFCKRNQSNRYVPQIRGLPIKVHGGVMAIRLEVLTPMTTSQWLDFMKHYRDVEAGRTHDPQLMQCVQFIQSKDEDLSQHNIMMRGSQPVIIDPLAG